MTYEMQNTAAWWAWTEKLEIEFDTVKKKKKRGGLEWWARVSEHEVWNQIIFP